MPVSIIIALAIGRIHFWDKSSRNTVVYKLKKEGKYICILLFFLLAACYFDYRTDKIPNSLICLGLFMALSYRIFTYIYDLPLLYGFLFAPAPERTLPAFAADIALTLLRITGAFLVLYPFYGLGMLGAGDIKLYILSLAFLNAESCLPFLFGSLFWAGVLSVIKLFYLKDAKERFYYFCSYVAEVARSGRWRLYTENNDARFRKKSSIHMAGPILAGFLLQLCNLYSLTCTR